VLLLGLALADGATGSTVPAKVHSSVLCLSLVAILGAMVVLGYDRQARSADKVSAKVEAVGARVEGLERLIQEQADAQGVGAMFQGYMKGIFAGTAEAGELRDR
jgi:hypothetical protein